MATKRKTTKTSSRKTQSRSRTAKRTPQRTTQSRRSSGNPGGGAGRREQVGGSGVYPASGPLPPQNAPYQGMASWGQGERGAEGYFDSGRSEIFDVGKPEQNRPPTRKRSSAGTRKTRANKTPKK